MMQDIGRNESCGIRRRERDKNKRILSSLKRMDLNPSKCSVEDAASPRVYLAAKHTPSSNRLHSTTSSQNESDRVFVCTNSSIFFEPEQRDLSKSKMKQIPISPMYDAKPGMVWTSEFFGRGGTSCPSQRSEKSELSLPELDNMKHQQGPQPLFSRDAAPSPSSSLSTSPVSIPSVSSSDMSCRVKVSSASTRRGRHARSASHAHPSPVKKASRVQDRLFTTERETERESEIEPWAFTIISKYQSEATLRPQSRCTARHQQSSSGIGSGGPPMGLGAMIKSKSCSHMVETTRRVDYEH